MRSFQVSPAYVPYDRFMSFAGRWCTLIACVCSGLSCSPGNDRLGLTPPTCPASAVAVGDTIELSAGQFLIEDRILIIVWTGGSDVARFVTNEGEVNRVEGERSVTVRALAKGEVTIAFGGTAVEDTDNFDVGGANYQFGGACTIQVGGSGDSSGVGNNGCNPPCGFDDAAPDGMKAAAVCDITVPDGTFQGSSTDDASCESDADCEDGDPCTTNTCVGAVVKICQSTEVTDCGASNLSIMNGDELNISFDRTIQSVATVNGLPTTVGETSKTFTWTVEGLSAGEQILLIEWDNREGADPASGCHEVTVIVR